MKKHQFKPFDQVLVRDSDEDRWLINHYACTRSTEDGHNVYICSIGSGFFQCIPYNEETKHLIDTTEAYTPPQPKEWEIRSNNGTYVDKFTSSELENFIKTAVINNKDITNFTVTRIF